ncbi:MAG TPA: hypothetical protein VF120_05335 [Ktedonobacterales bacterium]
MGYDPYAQTVATASPPDAPKKRSLKWLWITLAVVAALLIVGGGGAIFALVQYAQPAAAAGTFCGDLKAQNYTAAYNMLSAKMQAAYNSTAFAQGNAALDAAEGKVTACGAASGSSAYQYSLGGSTATLTATLTREKQGSLQGGVHLVNQSGWKVDGLDTSLLGINLGALQTLGSYCAAMESQNYSTAYGFLGGTLASDAGSADIFAEIAQLQDQVDGKVTGCAITAIPAGNTDTSTTVTATLTRSTLGAKSGNITLTATNGTWKITQVADALQGTDLGPLVTGSIFGLALVGGDFADAYKLLTPELQAQFTQTQFQQLFALPAGYKYVAATPDLSTYKVTSTSASYAGTVTYTDPSNATHQRKFNITLDQVSGAWLVSGFVIAAA